MSSTTPRSKRANPYALDELFVTFHHSTAGTLWRWRTELVMILALIAAVWWLTFSLTFIWAMVTMAALLALALAVPSTRRFITRRYWCILARHRLQRVCYEARLHTRSGRLPLVLWIRPTKVGERARVWCRAGISDQDFADNTAKIAAACYARDARVSKNSRWSHLVTIDIIRRDMLAARNTVTSPLQRLTERSGPGPAPVPEADPAITP